MNVPVWLWNASLGIARQVVYMARAPVVGEFVVFRGEVYAVVEVLWEPRPPHSPAVLQPLLRIEPRKSHQTRVQPRVCMDPHCMDDSDHPEH